MYCIYVIMNEKGKCYTGVTSNLEGRLKKHDHHGSKWTKRKGPWKLVVKEDFKDKRQAVARERQIKSYKGGKAFKRLIGPATAVGRRGAGPLA